MPFQLIWAVYTVNHGFYSSLWFNWKLSAHTLKVWKRDLFFTVIPILAMEFFTVLHTASPLRLLWTSGQLEDRGSLLKTDCPAQHPSGWTGMQRQLTPFWWHWSQGKKCSISSKYFFSIFLTVSGVWNLVWEDKIQRQINSVGACCTTHTYTHVHIQTSTLLSTLPC